MSATFDSFSDKLAELTLGVLGTEASRRLSGLYAARSAMPDADVYDRIRLARYILTGSEDSPALPDYEDVQNMAGETVIRLDRPKQSEDYPFSSGDVLVLGPEIFAGSDDKINLPRPDSPGLVINWRGVNFVRDPRTEAEPEALTGVVGPDPAFFGPVDGDENEDTELQAMAPPQTVEEVAEQREPAPSAGKFWAGRRGGHPA